MRAACGLCRRQVAAWLSRRGRVTACPKRAATTAPAAGARQSGCGIWLQTAGGQATRRARQGRGRCDAKHRGMASPAADAGRGGGQSGGRPVMRAADLVRRRRCRTCADAGTHRCAADARRPSAAGARRRGSSRRRPPAAGPRTSGSPRRFPAARLLGEPPEHTHEGDLVREAQPIVGAPPQGDLSSVGLEEGGIADQAGTGDVGVGDRHSRPASRR